MAFDKRTYPWNHYPVQGKRISLELQTVLCAPLQSVPLPPSSVISGLSLWIDFSVLEIHINGTPEYVLFPSLSMMRLRVIHTVAMYQVFVPL